MGYPYFVTGNASQTKDIISKDPSKYVGIYSLSPDYAVYGTAYPAWIQSLIDGGKFGPRSKSFFTITSDNPYSADIAKGMTATFQSMGWKLAGNEVTPTQDIKDWGAVISKIRSADPDVVINTDFLSNNEASFLSQFLENPTKSILYLDYAPALPEFIPLTGAKSTGVTSAVAGAPINTLPRTQEIKAAFKAKFGVDTGKYGVALYESVYLYKDALEKVCDPTKRQQIGEALAAVDKDIAMGHLQFDPATHLAKTGPDTYPFPIYQIWDQKLTLVAPEKYADASFQLPPWMN
jgi:branched-chain amino acid transport system substrate-binding protein